MGQITVRARKSGDGAEVIRGIGVGLVVGLAPDRSWVLATSAAARLAT